MNRFRPGVHRANVAPKALTHIRVELPAAPLKRDPAHFSRHCPLIGSNIANLSLNTEWRLTDSVQVPPPHPPNKFPGGGWFPPSDPSYVNKHNSYVERIVVGGFRERVGVKVRHCGATRLSSVRSRAGDEQQTPLCRLFPSTVQPTSLIRKFTAHAHLKEASKRRFDRLTSADGDVRQRAPPVG